MGLLTSYGAEQLLKNAFGLGAYQPPSTALHADLLDGTGAGGTIFGIGSGVPKIPSLSPPGNNLVTDTGSAKQVIMSQNDYKVGEGTPEPDYRYVAISDDAENAWFAEDKGAGNPQEHSVAGTEFDSGDLTWSFAYCPMVGAAYDGPSMTVGKMYPTKEFCGSLMARIFQETLDNNGELPYLDSSVASTTWVVRLLEPDGTPLTGGSAPGYADQSWSNGNISTSSIGGYYLLNSATIEWTPTAAWPDIGFVEVLIGATPIWIGKIATITGVTTDYTVRLDPSALKCGFSTVL